MSWQWLLVNGLLAALSWSVGQQPASSATCPEYDRVEYSAPRKDWPGSISIENVAGKPRAIRRASGAKSQRSPHGTAWYALKEPDTTNPGPWTSVVEVFGNQARPIHLRIRLSEHSSGGVRVRWLNEKLLWLQMWRGRIVSTDMILDIESGQFIYDQDANYNSLIVPCSMKPGFSK